MQEEKLNADMASQKEDAGGERPLLNEENPFRCKVCKRTAPKNCTEWFCGEALDAESPFSGESILSPTNAYLDNESFRVPLASTLAVPQPGSSSSHSSPP